MSLHATVLATLTRRSIEHEFGVAEFGANPASSPEQTAVDDQAASGALLDRYHTHVFQTFGQTKPMFGQRHQVRVILYKHRHIEFRAQHRSELDVAALKHRAPVHRPRAAIDISWHADTDAANPGKLHLGFADTSSYGLGYEIG